MQLFQTIVIYWWDRFQRVPKGMLLLLLTWVTTSQVLAVDPIQGSTPDALITRDQHFLYRFFEDQAATAKDPAPLIVFLHGLVERGSDNQKQVRNHNGPLIDKLMNDPTYHGHQLAPQSSNSW